MLQRRLFAGRASSAARERTLRSCPAGHRPRAEAGPREAVPAAAAAGRAGSAAATAPAGSAPSDAGPAAAHPVSAHMAGRAGPRLAGPPRLGRRPQPAHGHRADPARTPDPHAQADHPAAERAGRVAPLLRRRITVSRATNSESSAGTLIEWKRAFKIALLPWCYLTEAGPFLLLLRALAQEEVSLCR